MPLITRSVLVLTLFGTALGLSSCATPGRRSELERVRPGLDKARVLELVGNPKRTSRTNGLDHWTYQFYEYDRELIQQIDFRDGRVTKVGQPTTRRGADDALENADSMEDYERAVKARQKKSAGFEDVPGGADEPK